MASTNTVLAKSIRTQLRSQGVALSHRQTLDIIARVKGFAGWEAFKEAEKDTSHMRVSWAKVLEARITGVQRGAEPSPQRVLLVNRPGLSLLDAGRSALERLNCLGEFAFKLEGAASGVTVLGDLVDARVREPGVIELASGDVLQLFTSPQKHLYAPLLDLREEAPLSSEELCLA